MVRVRATERFRGLGGPVRPCKLFPAVVARSVRHCSAGVLLSSSGGGGGRWVPAAAGLPGYRPALGKGGERRGLSLKTPSWS